MYAIVELKTDEAQKE